MKVRTGSLVKRGSGYSCKIMIEGKLISRALKNPDGTPSKTLVEARRAQADFAKVFGLGSKADALQAIQTRLADVQSEIDETESPKAKLADCWERYLSSPDKLGSGEHTLKAYCQYARDFVRWTQARYPQAVYLADVTKGIAGEYAAHLTGKGAGAGANAPRIAPKGYNGCTFNKHLIFLRVLFRVLCEDLPNPFGKVKNKPIDSVSHEPLSQDQLKAVLSKTTGELNLLLLIGAFTALRLGDACLLRWQQVDLDKNTITVTPSKTASRSIKRVVIPIHPELKNRLATQFQKGEFVLPWVAWRYQNDISAMSHKIHAAFEAAGIHTKNAEGRTVYSFHSLRFSMGQALISSGFSLDVISQVLGHSSQTMSRHYSTVTDTVRSQAILSLPSIVSA